jgi:hypothetical protein
MVAAWLVNINDLDTYYTFLCLFDVNYSNVSDFLSSGEQRMSIKITHSGINSHFA